MTFEQWMADNHYRPTTIKKTLAGLGRALQPGKRDPNVTDALRRYLTYANAAGVDDEYTAQAEDEGLTTVAVARMPHEKPKRRKFEARSFDDGAWEHVNHRVQDSTDAREQVIWLLCTTGLRIGDVLRIDMTTLNEAVKTGVLTSERKGGVFTQTPLGVPEPWMLVQKAMRKLGVENIAQYVCADDPNPEAGGCAYQRVHRRVKRIARDLGLDTRVHTHKFRRTVGVHVHKLTGGDITAVQQMLGHGSPLTSMGYVDEVNLERTKDLQQKIAVPMRAKR